MKYLQNLVQKFNSIKIPSNHTKIYLMYEYNKCSIEGTPFMAKLHLQLQYFVTKKITTDSTWKGVNVILSGHEVS